MEFGNMLLFTESKHVFFYLEFFTPTIGDASQGAPDWPPGGVGGQHAGRRREGREAEPPERPPRPRGRRDATKPCTAFLLFLQTSSAPPRPARGDPRPPPDPGCSGVPANGLSGARGHCSPPARGAPHELSPEPPQVEAATAGRPGPLLRLRPEPRVRRPGEERPERRRQGRQSCGEAGGGSSPPKKNK